MVTYQKINELYLYYLLYPYLVDTKFKILFRINLDTSYLRNTLIPMCNKRVI